MEEVLTGQVEEVLTGKLEEVLTGQKLTMAELYVIELWMYLYGDGRFRAHNRWYAGKNEESRERGMQQMKERQHIINQHIMPLIPQHNHHSVWDKGVITIIVGLYGSGKTSAREDRCQKSYE